MKLISKLAVTSAVIALAFISSANAQSMRVDVPFGFSAGKLSLPAGAYRVDLNMTSQRVTLNQLGGKANCFLTVKALNASSFNDLGSLVFNRYGSSYFLTRVKSGGAGIAAELYTSPAERELAKAKTESKSAIIIAAGR